MLSDLFCRQRRHQRLAEPRDDFRRRARGSHQAVVQNHVVTRVSGLRHGRDLRQQRRTLAARHRERAQRARADMAVNIRDGADDQWNMAAEHIVERRRRAAIGNVPQLCARLDGEQLAGKMIDGANAGSAEVDDLAGLLADPDEVAKRLRRIIRFDHQHARNRADEADRGEILASVVADVELEIWHDPKCRVGREQDRVTIRRAARDHAGAKRASGPAMMVDDDPLTKLGAHFVGDNPRHDARAATGNKRDNERDRPARIILGDSRSRHDDGCTQRESP